MEMEAPIDWFTLYVQDVQAAKEDGEHMAKVLCASVGKYDGDPAVLAGLHTSYQTAMAALRTKLLATPVGATFPGMTSPTRQSSGSA